MRERIILAEKDIDFAIAAQGSITKPDSVAAQRDILRVSPSALQCQLLIQFIQDPNTGGFERQRSVSMLGMQVLHHAKTGFLAGQEEIVHQTLQILLDGVRRSSQAIDRKEAHKLIRDIIDGYPAFRENLQATVGEDQLLTSFDQGELWKMIPWGQS